MESVGTILSISKKIEKMINTLNQDVFYTYKDRLMVEKKEYIVPAVWGVVKDGELDETQLSIYGKIGPVVDQVLEAMSADNLSVPQKFAIRYLVNQMIITTIIYMTEIANNSMNNSTLKNMNPVGNA